MEIGLRILAIAIDLALCAGIGPYFAQAFGWVLVFMGPLGQVFLPFLSFSYAIFPILYFGLSTGLWGKTLGKWICRLYVTGDEGGKPGFWQAMGRETLKLLAIGSGLGIMFCLFQITCMGGVWYDQLCGTEVRFNPYVRLTPTQKRWRQAMKEAQRDQDSA